MPVQNLCTGFFLLDWSLVHRPGAVFFKNARMRLCSRIEGRFPTRRSNSSLRCRRRSVGTARISYCALRADWLSVLTVRKRTLSGYWAAMEGRFFLRRPQWPHPGCRNTTIAGGPSRVTRLPKCPELVTAVTSAPLSPGWRLEVRQPTSIARVISITQ